MNFNTGLGERSEVVDKDDEEDECLLEKNKFLQNKPYVFLVLALFFLTGVTEFNQNESLGYLYGYRGQGVKAG